MKKFKRYSFLIVLFLFLLLIFISVATYADGKLMKEISIEKEDSIFIKAGGAEIVFDDSSKKIALSEELIVECKNNQIFISSPIKTFNPFNNKRYKIIIGTARKYNTVNLNVGGAVISGILKADRISINGGGLNINADFYGNRVNFNGGGINVTGKISAEQVNLNGAGMVISITVEKNTKDLSFNGTGIDVDIKYEDPWEGIRYLSMSGLGGSIKVLVPEENNDAEKGQLDINTDGIIDVDIDYY